MANEYVDMNTVRFLLYDVHELEELLTNPYFEDYDRAAIDIFLGSVKDFADQDLFPYFREMDEQPAHYKDGKIIVHPHLKVAIEKAAELGLLQTIFSLEEGGLQIPFPVHTAAGFILDAANNHVPGYYGLTMGAAQLIVSFGSRELIDAFVPPMQSGQWGGTMCLTEPQAGSSLSDVITSATPLPDGSYSIKGQKIFISGGDHEYVENIVHLVLARIDGAPPGTKGISLFVVPKHRPVEGGGLEPNDVLTAGDFQKMGQRGYCTTHLVFGENEECRGWLVGYPNEGLKNMFQMMNGARIDVGRGAAAITMAAYLASLQYARERPQGRALSRSGKKDVNQGQTLIINHPDVRRMLLLQKAVAEGALSLVIQAATWHDLEKIHPDPEARERYHLLVELLTPIVKTYPSEMGRTAVDNGLQVLGGYGFCSEFVLQQYYRDIRIFSIYEGTTGIQSIDLLGRKLTTHGGKAAHLIGQEMGKTMNEARNYPDLLPYAETLGHKIKQAQEVIGFLSGFAGQGEYERFLSDATLFMEFFSTIVVGWQWLKMAVQARQALVTGRMDYSEAFFENKVRTMKFYYKYEMAKTNSLAEILQDKNTLTLRQEADVFS